MIKVCDVCGEHFETESKRKKMCPKCDAECYKKPPQKKRQQTESMLDKLLIEIETYNSEHGTNLSYGQYVSKFGM